MGFKGSPGFMAPEILKYVGLEAVTEKVRLKEGERGREGEREGGRGREGEREGGREGGRRGRRWFIALSLSLSLSLSRCAGGHILFRDVHV